MSQEVHSQKRRVRQKIIRARKEKGEDPEYWSESLQATASAKLLASSTISADPGAVLPATSPKVDRRPARKYSSMLASITVIQFGISDFPRGIDVSRARG